MQKHRLVWLICVIGYISQYAAASSFHLEHPLQREVARVRQRRSQRLEEAELGADTWNHTGRHLLGTRPGWAVPSQQMVRMRAHYAV